MENKEKKILKAISHNLKPVINIGKKGITQAQIKKIDETVDVKELIKIKILSNAPQNAREDLITNLNGMNCEIVQEKGKIITIYRKKIPNED